MTKKTNNLSASLRQKIQNIIHQEDGFSFIEVIIVIAMILILSAILIPSYFGFVESAREANVKISAQNMYTAVQMANLSLEDISTSKDLFDELQRLNPALVGIGAVFDVSKTTNENDEDDYLEVAKLTGNDPTEVSPLLIAKIAAALSSAFFSTLAISSTRTPDAPISATLCFTISIAFA